MSNISLAENNIVHQQEIRIEVDWVFGLKVALAVSACFFFIYVNGVMLFTLRSKSTFRESSRYILFAHMLFNDSVQLLTSVLLYIFAVAYLHIVRAVCAVIVIMSSTTFYSSPLNLALMSLERYIAICFPLRHSEIVTPKRTILAICVVWFFGSINQATDVIGILITDPSFFLTSVFCTQENMLKTKWQVDMKIAITSIYFATVGVILLYTYAAIMLEARSVSSDRASATKARNTVLLHAVQLSLCLTSFLYGVIEALLARMTVSVFIHLRYLNFVVLLILPRCLSPLIYGLRDESFRPLFKYYFTCSSKKTIYLLINITHL
uniref:Kappa-type opioid receptor-like n=1 Tax=Lepisosteus oculatus TaxID=7918 RepID=W5MFV5_LEPOC